MARIGNTQAGTVASAMSMNATSDSLIVRKIRNPIALTKVAGSLTKLLTTLTRAVCSCPVSPITRLIKSPTLFL